MRKKDPDRIIKDLQDYRVDGDGQRVLEEAFFPRPSGWLGGAGEG